MRVPRGLGRRKRCVEGYFNYIGRAAIIARRWDDLFNTLAGALTLLAKPLSRSSIAHRDNSMASG